MLLIFDWDGTLADSTAKIVNCLTHASVDVALPVLSAAEYQHIIGLALPEAAAALYPDASNEQRFRFIEAYKVRFTADHDGIQFFEGVEQGLPVLKRQGFKLAVATSKGRRGLNRQLQYFGVEHWFDATRCADETASKPHPKMLHELLLELDVASEDAVMIGDTTFDMEMASRANVKGLGVSYGAHSAERIASANPFAVASDFIEVYSVLVNTFQERINPKIA